eukprot:TRINITY_DN3404_c0_g1_i1.p1 TRINITY_DN3404_c0_g1~~TRINITY_DN3404_c0_g1_i1.p1  ORF type:complete len:323 (-),score=108.11 TRINITY_DN3404_c0_g1_i1:200-1168(-)
MDKNNIPVYYVSSQPKFTIDEQGRKILVNPIVSLNSKQKINIVNKEMKQTIPNGAPPPFSRATKPADYKLPVVQSVNSINSTQKINNVNNNDMKQTTPNGAPPPFSRTTKPVDYIYTENTKNKANPLQSSQNVNRYYIIKENTNIIIPVLKKGKKDRSPSRNNNNNIHNNDRDNNIVPELNNEKKDVESGITFKLEEENITTQEDKEVLVCNNKVEKHHQVQEDNVDKIDDKKEEVVAVNDPLSMWRMSLEKLDDIDENDFIVKKQTQQKNKEKKEGEADDPSNNIDNTVNKKNNRYSLSSLNSIKNIKNKKQKKFDDFNME